MRPEHWKITLEAYIDGELPPQEAASFLELVNTNPAMAAEMKTRLSLRQDWQKALLSESLAQSETMAVPPIHRRRGPIPLWIPVALAACLVLVFGVSRQLSNGGGSSYQVTIAGQVSALRYGERPHKTLVLKTGYLELPAASSR